MRRRTAFTLVEVLVALAVTLFIMVILTEAFSAGLATFRALKAQGDMQERLRAASGLLRDDLVHYHFDAGQKLSTLSAAAPRAGYFYIRQSGSVLEGIDGYGIPSYRMNADAPPLLCFTVNLYTPPGVPPALSDKGFLPNDFFVARIPDAPGDPGPLPAPTAAERLLFACGPADYLPAPLAPRGPPANNVFLSQWAEVAYFVVPTGRFAGTTNPVPLFSLRRRTRAVLSPGLPGTPEEAAALGLNSTGPRVLNVRVGTTDVYSARYAEVSCFPDASGRLYFNSPIDLLERPGSRMYARPLGPMGMPGGEGQLAWYGDDLVMTDMISFNVRVLSPGAAEFADLGTPGTPGAYDSSTLTPLSALEITLRVWDVKTSLARQVTIVQDM